MGLTAGADGGIGTTYNIMLDVIRGIYDSFVAHDIENAQREQARANQVISTLLNYRLIPAVKAVLEDMGFAVGNATFPMKQYREDQKRPSPRKYEKRKFSYNNIEKISKKTPCFLVNHVIKSNKQL